MQIVSLNVLFSKIHSCLNELYEIQDEKHKDFIQNVKKCIDNMDESLTLISMLEKSENGTTKTAINDKNNIIQENLNILFDQFKLFYNNYLSHELKDTILYNNYADYVVRKLQKSKNLC